MKEDKIYTKFGVGAVAPKQFPTLLLEGNMNEDGRQLINIPRLYPFQNEWGKIAIFNISDSYVFLSPISIKISWISLIEQKIYSVSKKLIIEQSLERKYLQMEKGENNNLYGNIVFGMAPYGGVAIWLYCETKEILLEWFYATVSDIKEKEFLQHSQSTTLDEYCSNFLNLYSSICRNIAENALPSPNLFDKYMQQFIYRYQVVFRQWGEEGKEWNLVGQSSQSDAGKKTKPEFDYIEEALFDGTHDKLHDGGLMKYHEAGKPKKLAVKWHIKKSEYTAYFWFEDEAIRNVFDRFYGAHPETKTDFMIRIDSEKNKYELALYRCGLKEPQIISESAYQLIVFKNQFECFRSENYNQPRGAWIW